MSRNATWHQRTFGGPTKYQRRSQIANWLTQLENDGDVTAIEFNEDELSITVFARVEHNVSRIKIRMDTGAVSVEEVKAISAEAVARAISNL
jgi:hypothetical protein